MENNVLLNNGMATSNPYANVNSVTQNSQSANFAPQSASSSAQSMQNGQINPITIPIQIQPQIGQTQTPTSVQPNNNLQVNQPQYNAPTPQSYQNNNQTNNVVDFNQIYSNYQKAYGNTYNTNPTASNSGIKKTSIGTTIVTPTTTNLNSVQGQYQSAYSDTINGIIGNMLSNVNNGFQYDPTTDSSLKVATEYAANTTLQSLAGSGVLNSSATSERVARIVADLIPQYEEKAHNRWTEYLGQLADTAQLVMNFDNQQFAYWADAKDREFQEKEFEFNKRQKELENAWKRVDELGFADNEASSILGVKVGTLSSSAREAKEQREFELNKMREQFELERENDIAITKLKSELELNNSRAMARYNADIEKEIYGYKSDIDTAQTKELSDYQLQNDKNLYSYKSNVDTQQSKNLADYQANIDKDLYNYKSNVDTAQSKALSDYQLNNDKSLYKYRTNLDTAQSIQLANNQLKNDKDLYNYKSNVDTAQSKALSDYQLNNDKSLYQYRTNLDTQQSKELANYNNQLSNSSKEYEYKLAEKYGASNSSNKSSSSKTSLSTYKDIIENRWGVKDVDGKISLRDDVSKKDNNNEVFYYIADEIEAGRMDEQTLDTLVTLYNIRTPALTHSLEDYVTAVFKKSFGDKEKIAQAVINANEQIQSGDYRYTSNSQLISDLAKGKFGEIK